MPQEETIIIYLTGLKSIYTKGVLHLYFSLNIKYLGYTHSLHMRINKQLLYKVATVNNGEF